MMTNLVARSLSQLFRLQFLLDWFGISLAVEFRVAWQAILKNSTFWQKKGDLQVTLVFELVRLLKCIFRRKINNTTANGKQFNHKIVQLRAHK